MPTSSTTGMQLAERFPNAAMGGAKYVAKETGVDPTPENLAMVMQSKTFTSTMIRAARDKRLAERIYKQGDETIAAASQEPVPFNRSAPLQQQAEDTYTMRQDAMLTQARARNVVSERMAESAEKLSKLSDFDSDSYMRARIKEENPTADIDDRILNLRIEAITSKAQLRNQYKHLLPSMRNQIESEHMQKYSDTIDTLKEIRDSRLTQAKDRIQDEIDSKNEQKRTAKSSVDAYKAMLDQIKDTGDFTEARGKLEMEMLKEVKKYGKAAKEGIPDEEETIVNYLLDQIRKGTPANDGGWFGKARAAILGEVPSAAQIVEAKRIAKVTVADRKKKRAMVSGRSGPVEVTPSPGRIPSQYKPE